MASAIYALSCRGHGDVADGMARAQTVVIGATAEPRSLLPPFAADLVAGELCDLLYQHLVVPAPGFSTIGDRDYHPDLATQWQWAADSLSIRFALDASARWHDGRPVTSADVRFTYNLLRDPSMPEARPWLADLVDSVSTPDPHTAVLWVRGRDPSLFHRLTYAVHILPAHLLARVPRRELSAHAANRAPVGSGPFRLTRWSAGTIELARTAAPASPGALRRELPLERVVLRIAPDYRAAVAGLEAGEIDVVDFLRPEDARRLRGNTRLASMRLPGYGYAVLQLNLRAPTRGSGERSRSAGSDTRAPHPILGNRAFRRALAMSVDRLAITANLLDTLGHVSPGPVTRGQATFDSTLGGPAYDPPGARRLLDSLGWRLPAGQPAGVRQRGETPLRLTILVPGSSATRVRAAVLLQHMLAQVGIAVAVDQRDNATVVSVLQRGAFDAALTAFRVDPDPGGVRDAWGGEAARRGSGFNFGRYEDAETDRLLARAAGAPDLASARTRYRLAYRRIVDAEPAVFLYEPEAVVVYDRRLHPAGARPDAWWASLAAWRIAPPAPDGSRGSGAPNFGSH